MKRTVIRRLRPAALRGIVSSREWTAYRLTVFRSNLAIGALLRSLRLGAGVRQVEIARALRVSPQAVGAWESGRARISSYQERRYRDAVVDRAERRAA